MTASGRRTGRYGGARWSSTFTQACTDGIKAFCVHCNRKLASSKQETWWWRCLCGWRRLDFEARFVLLVQPKEIWSGLQQLELGEDGAVQDRARHLRYCLYIMRFVQMEAAN